MILQAVFSLTQVLGRTRGDPSPAASSSMRRFGKLDIRKLLVRLKLHLDQQPLQGETVNHFRPAR
jgi:hypothetical protein